MMSVLSILLLLTAELVAANIENAPYESPNHDFIMKVMKSIQTEYGNSEPEPLTLSNWASALFSTCCYVAPSTYIDWQSTVSTNTSNTNKITVVYNVKPTITYPATFWSSTFPSGYIGIQRLGDSANGQVNGLLIFSVWDVYTSAFTEIQDGFYYISFGGEGTGGSIRKNLVGINNIENTLYSFKVVYENIAGSSTASITAYYAVNQPNIFNNDEYDNVNFIKIATVIVPNSNKYLFNGNNRFTHFLEDFASISSNGGEHKRKGIYYNLMIDEVINGIQRQEKFKTFKPNYGVETRPHIEGNAIVDYGDQERNTAFIEIGGITQ